MAVFPSGGGENPHKYNTCKKKIYSVFHKRSKR